MSSYIAKFVRSLVGKLDRKPKNQQGRRQLNAGLDAHGNLRRQPIALRAVY